MSHLAYPLNQVVYLKDGNPRQKDPVKGKNVDGRHDCQEELKLVDGSREEPLEAQAEHFEHHFLKKNVYNM